MMGRAVPKICLLALGLSLPPAGIHAAEPTLVELRYQAPSGCPDRAAFVKEVERRSESVRWGWGGNDAISVNVAVSGVESDYRATVALGRAETAPVTRSIAGRTCEEVVEAAALVVAVLLPSPREAEPEPLPRAPSVLPEQVAEQPGLRWRLGAGMGAVLVSGVTPGMFPGYEFFGALRTSADGWAPAVRIGFRNLSRLGVGVGEGDEEASFESRSFTLEACPVAHTGAYLVVRPCATANYGVLRARGWNADTNRSESHPWSTAGGGVLLEIPVLSGFVIGIDGGVEAALYKARFAFSRVTFHETSRLNGRLEVAVIGSFPL